MVDIIEKKRDGGKLSPEEIRFAVMGYAKGDIPDYQMSALCMAIVFRGMDKEETATLTDAMMHSGETIDLSSIHGIKVDKHSTGGVGDKTSLVLGPLVSANGAKLAKMSGRGLGHTGGTLDKMESVPGMRIALSEEEFVKQVNDIGIAIIGQTQDIDPADKKMYALRDVTGTVESIPLIASSIMSKKLAAGSDAILLDVKFGSGAFMKTFEMAKTLATTMVEIGKSLGRDTRAIITDMDQPLGLAVGNSVELVEEAGSIMLEQAHIVKTHEEGIAKIKETIDNGEAFKKLVAFFKAQGGDISYLENPEKFEKAKYETKIIAENDGYVSQINSMEIGVSAMRLGAGRATMSDVIDMSAGIILAKKVGDEVKKGDLLATCYTNKTGVDSVYKDVHDAFKLQKEKVKVSPIVHAYIK